MHRYLKLPSTTVDLGKIKGSTQNEVEFKFTNEGKSDLDNTGI